MVSVSQSASITINGITPVAGPGMTLLASPQLSTTNVQHGDYFANTFTVNPITTVTVLPIGSIATASVLWIRTDFPITVTITQNAVDKDFTITDFVMLNGTFTALKLANADLLQAAHVAVLVAGDRITNPGTAGIF